MLKDVKKLYDLGYALHLLKPNSKQPLENKWSKGERKTWKELKNSYQYGNNIGVRLGAASKLTDGSFLSVIDCDVKSSDPKHEKQMLEKLSELIQGKVPEVYSGRGNGSRHLHIRTKEPISPFRFSQSPEKVKVHMPSIVPSKKDAELLSKKELDKGYRMRPAWEISVMGEGQQVVLPPSTHPDTGLPYEWGRSVNVVKDLPLIDFGKARVAKEKQEIDVSGFTPVEVDLVGSSLNDTIVDMIISGKNCDDRSVGVYTGCVAMLKAGFSDEEILSVFTDRENYLGQTAYDHAQTKKRSRAAQWVMKFNLQKAREATSAENDFEDDVDDRKLSKEDAEKQKKELVRELTWEERLDRGGQPGFKLKPTFKNIVLILQNEISPELFKRNEFANADYYGSTAPWAGARIGKEVNDDDALEMKAWFGNKYNLELPTERMHEAINLIANRNRFHPVREYLEGLKWDGKSRLDTWLKDYLGAEGEEPYLTEVSQLILVGMVSRIFSPGVKFDHVAILEGNQGIGKSSALRILSDPWFSDAHLNIGDKDTVVGLRSVWLYEIGELSGMRKAEVNQLKAFISQQSDRIRAPYGRRTENFDRQCVFIGTTNSAQYLMDATGERRFWPVEVGQCKFDKLKRDRDQLFAEAVVFFQLNGDEPIRLSKKAEAQAKLIQSDKSVTDFVYEKLKIFLENGIEKKHLSFDPKKFALIELLDDLDWQNHVGNARANPQKLTDYLKKLGYRHERSMISGNRKRRWVKQNI